MISRLKPFVFLLCLMPFGQLAYNAYIGDLGVNPIDFITRFTGSWTLIFLIGTLAVTPARRLTGWNDLIKLRRMLGLFAFAYASMHFATYLVLDHFFDWQAIGKDIVKRPYVTAGFTAFVIMVPLALTSTAGMIRRLGKRWQKLHRLIYVAALAGVIHFYWLVKADIRRPAQYGFFLAVLLFYRIALSWRSSISKSTAKPVGRPTQKIVPGKSLHLFSPPRAGQDE
jgi:methionine sulfoxide reductase heme-binding subunit